MATPQYFDGSYKDSLSDHDHDHEPSNKKTHFQAPNAPIKSYLWQRELKSLDESTTQQFSFKLEANEFTDADHTKSNFYEVTEMIDHGSPAGRVTHKGKLLNVRLYLNPTYKRIYYHEEAAYMIALKSIALVGGFGVVAWLLF